MAQLLGCRRSAFECKRDVVWHSPSNWRWMDRGELVPARGRDAARAETLWRRAPFPCFMNTSPHRPERSPDVFTQSTPPMLPSAASDVKTLVSPALEGYLF